MNPISVIGKIVLHPKQARCTTSSRTLSHRILLFLAVVMSSTGLFEVRYDESLSGSISSTPTTTTSPTLTTNHPYTLAASAPPINTSNVVSSTRLLSSLPPSPESSESPILPSSFQFDVATSNSSDPTSSPQFRSPHHEPTTSDGLTETMKYTPSIDTTATTPSQSPSILSPDPLATAVIHSPPRTSTSSLQLSADDDDDDDDDDPFELHSNQLAHRQQARMLASSSYQIQSPPSESAQFDQTLRVSTQRSPSSPPSQSQSRTLTQTVPRMNHNANGIQPVPVPSSLSSLSSATLRTKVSEVAKLIAEFDRQFLVTTPSGNDRYPSWALPFVSEMATKMNLVLRAQHLAEEREEEEARQSALHHHQQRVRWNEEEVQRHRRRDEREAEARESQRKVEGIAQLQAAAASGSSPNTTTNDSNHQQRHSLKVPPSSGAQSDFYHDAVYTVALQSDLPFLRDHGLFHDRRQAANSGLSSPRRNLGEKDPNSLMYQHVRSSRRPISAKSRHYLTSLMGHDINATMLNGAMRATSRSPNRELRRRAITDSKRREKDTNVKEPIGPTIPKAERWSQSYSHSPLGSRASVGEMATAKKTPKKIDPRPRDREMELEVTALRLKVEELLDTIHDKDARDRAAARDRDRDRDRHRHRSASRSRSRSPRRRHRSHRRRSRSRSRSQSPSTSRMKKTTLSKSTSVSSLTTSTNDSNHNTQQQPPPPSSSFDEDELAAALIRIGEANREKFLLLIQQIAFLQQKMVDQQSRMDAMDSHSGADAATAAAGNSSQSSTAAEHDAMRRELERLQRELAQSLADKERLSQRVRDLVSSQEKDKFRLLEQVTDLSATSQDARRNQAQDEALLKAYEQDLRTSRDAILHLQDLVRREAEYAKSFKNEKENLQRRLDELNRLLEEKSAQEKDAAYKSGRASLKPGAKFQSFMHKYLASYYRKEFQNLLAERNKNLAAVQRVEMEITRTKEKHELELVYASKAHESVLAHVSQALYLKQDHETQLQEQLEYVNEKLEKVENEKVQKEQDLIATELMNVQLSDALREKNSILTENAFTELMIDSFKGDYLQSRNDPKVLKVVYELGDEEIKFSDYVTRIDRSVLS